MASGNDILLKKCKAKEFLEIYGTEYVCFHFRIYIKKSPPDHLKNVSSPHKIEIIGLLTYLKCNFMAQTENKKRN